MIIVIITSPIGPVKGGFSFMNGSFRFRHTGSWATGLWHPVWETEMKKNPATKRQRDPNETDPFPALFRRQKWL
jgi:hypothetical protein